MRYAQIVMGLKDSGKSTYCKLMAKYAESRGRKMRIVNLDPTPGDLVYHPIANIRDVLKDNVKDIEEAEQSAPGTGAGFELALGYILDNPEWLFGSIGDSDYILFDCPGEHYFVHSKAMKVFATMLVMKHGYRACGIFLRDARMATNGYSFIGSCMTPLTSYINLSIPIIAIFTKQDLLSEGDIAKLQLFINSDNIRDVLRYENSRYKNFQCEGQPELAKLCSSTVAILEGHALVRKKYYVLDFKDDNCVKGCLNLIDEVLGIMLEED